MLVMPCFRTYCLPKKRFDSIATPLARMFVRLDAVLQVLVDVIREQRDTPRFKFTADVDLVEGLSDEGLWLIL